MKRKMILVLLVLMLSLAAAASAEDALSVVMNAGTIALIKAAVIPNSG